MSEQHTIDNATRAKLKAFRDLFLRWNKQINLSAARTESDVDEHITDSLAVVDELHATSRVLDVGSGGGFPVVVAAIALPAVQFTALEPVHKKHAFLRTAARELDLANLTALALRVEDHDVRDYDAAMSRATFDIAEWIARGLTYVRPGGIVIGFEGQQRDDLASNIRRRAYGTGDKTRALVIATR